MLTCGRGASSESTVIVSQGSRPGRRTRRISRSVAGALLLLSTVAIAQTESSKSAPPAGLEPVESVPPPPPLRSGEPLEPEVRIGPQQRGTVQEYYVGGRLVAIKVVPKNAPPYYLVDTDGDGNFDTRRDELGSDILINSWLLFTWP